MPRDPICQMPVDDSSSFPVGPDGSTSCRGLFAAGDVTDVFAKRIIIASGEGAKAAIAARGYLLHLDRRTTPEAKGG